MSMYLVWVTWMASKLHSRLYSQCNCWGTSLYWTLAEDFWHQWDFPNCIGAIDGKHVYIQPPPNSGSTDCTYYNYKNFNVR